uniref:Uncharacterized protein n=1 Tax=Anopheles culicifacies TaxID=139723 RepID=A0A182MMY7_9DIPT
MDSVVVALENSSCCSFVTQVLIVGKFSVFRIVPSRAVFEPFVPISPLQLPFVSLKMTFNPRNEKGTDNCTSHLIIFGKVIVAVNIFCLIIKYEGISRRYRFQFSINIEVNFQCGPIHLQCTVFSCLYIVHMRIQRGSIIIIFIIFRRCIRNQIARAQRS